VVLPAKLTLEIVRALEAGAVQVTWATRKPRSSPVPPPSRCCSSPPKDSPQQKGAEAEPVSVPTAELARAVRQVVRAASRDETRSVALTGVLLAAEADGLRLVATDSYRLALRDLPGLSLLSGETQVIVPARALSELVRVLGDADDVEVRLDANTASFTVGRVNVITRLIEAEYPNYRGLIPSNQPNHLTVGRDTLLEAVRRVGLMVQSTPTPIRLNTSGEQLELLAITPDRGEAREALSAKYEGEELTVAFNPEYLLDGIEATSGDEISIETVDGLKPAVLRSTDDEGFLYLLMPVRVS
jgi:DNA polymerase III subunit beta